MIYLKICKIISLYVVISFGLAQIALANSELVDIYQHINSNHKATIVIAMVDSQVDYNKNRQSINLTVSILQESVFESLNVSEYKIIHRYQSVPGLVLEIYSESTLAKLERNSAILKIDLDTGGYGAMNQSRPWINADDAQAIGFRGDGITVAVLDSGVDTNHTDLSDDLVYEHCICNTGENCCPTGGSVGAGSGSAEDNHGHGTHVIGTITGRGTTSPLGIAPNTKIVAVKVLNVNNTFCCASDITAALDWILNNRPDVSVINMSLGTSAEFSGVCDNATSWSINMANAVNALNTAGVISVAASMNNGNSTSIAAPACLSGTVAVGATFDNSDNVGSFSNSSPILGILAPGVNITSTQMGGGSATFSGTSMATAHVTAVVAMLQQAEPNKSLAEIESCLLSSSVQVTDSRNNLTHPRLDAMDALAACSYIIFLSGFE